jgi:iron complex outermembrane recepter protein
MQKPVFQANLANNIKSGGYMNKLRSGILLALSGAVMLTVVAPFSLAMAQDKDALEAKTLDSLTVVGSRRVTSSSSDTDTLVPVDVISITKASEQSGQFDLAQTLQYISPSFNSTRQTGADGADLVDSAALRGLGSDQTLLLMNGKRYHTTALVNLFGARNRGNTGSDLNTIPMLAVDRVEVLRDGAAAQYGSDAIAGVMNIGLKKRKGCEMVLGYGQYSRGDGKNYLGSAYCGLDIGNDGVLAVTAEYSDRGRSDRSDPDNPRIIGDSAVKNATVFINAQLPVSDTTSLYAVAGFQNRDASSAAFGRGGVGSDDIPSRNSAAMYPNGFVPFIDGDIQDRHISAGLKGMWGDWHWDFSQTHGYNRLDYNINNTLNASIANRDLLSGGRGISPTAFNAGGFSFQQDTTNFDISRYFDGAMSGVNVAFGTEFRHENYQIYAGESGSYIDADGVGIGGNAGSQGFPGFAPSDATDKSRNSWSLYGDVEVGFSERVTGDFAVRYEDYSDFGSTLTGKAALLFKATDTMRLRGSISTGFRAPSLQQRFFSSTFTDFISGEPLDVVLAPNGGVIANAAGIPALTEEKSKNYTLGMTWSPNEDTSLTIDLYRIDIDDRIVLSGRFDTSDPRIGPALLALGVGQAQFFVNSVDTTTQGIDFTFSQMNDFGAGKLNTTIALNLNDNEVTAIHAPPSLVGREDVLLSDRERLFLEEGAPKQKATLGFDYLQGKWNTNFKIIYFGSQTLGTFSGPPVPNAEYGAKTSADLSLTYNFSDKTRLTIGSTNIFDQFPDVQDSNETDNGHIYDSVQFGLNGRAYFARLFTRF